MRGIDFWLTWVKYGPTSLGQPLGGFSNSCIQLINIFLRKQQCHSQLISQCQKTSSGSESKVHSQVYLMQSAVSFTSKVWPFQIGRVQPGLNATTLISSWLGICSLIRNDMLANKHKRIHTQRISVETKAVYDSNRLFVLSDIVVCTTCNSCCSYCPESLLYHRVLPPHIHNNPHKWMTERIVKGL